MASFCYLPVLDGSIAVRGVGTGEPVVLLHSSASSSTQWRRIATRLADDRRVVMPDFPGCGDSTRWKGCEPRTLQADAAIVAAIAEHLGEPVHLVGHSYGGAVALAAAHHHPHAVRSLMLIEPVAFHLLDSRFDIDIANEVAALAETIWQGLCTGSHHDAMARFIDYWNGDGAWLRLPPERHAALSDAIAGIAQEFSAVLGCPLTDTTFAGLGLPVTLVSGVLSPLSARRLIARLSAILPDAWHHVIAGAGHMLPLSHPEETAAVLLAHLARAATHEETPSHAAAA